MTLRYQFGSSTVLSAIQRNVPHGSLEEESTGHGSKPFLAENLHRAMSEYVQTHKTAPMPEVSIGLPSAPSPKMAIKTNGKILFINPTELVSVHAEGNYVLLQKHAGSYLLRATMSEMLSKLERYGFIRIHRSLLVNKLFVEEMQPYPTGSYGLRLRGGKVYTVSRTYKKNLKALADSWIGTDSFEGE